MSKSRLALIAVVAVGLVAAGWLLRPMLFPSRLPEGILEAYGRIEGTEITVVGLGVLWPNALALVLIGVALLGGSVWRLKSTLG